VADAFYDNYRNLMLGDNEAAHSFPDMDTDTIKFILYDETDDALNLADQDIADIAAGGIVATSAGVAGKTVGTAGTGAFDHDNYTFTAQAGDAFESLTYYKDSGTGSTSPLICNLDSPATLPMTPNGGDIIWAPAAGGVFQIT
jgi:hypothetical protein